MQDKQRILLFIKTPPPITGATLMNMRVHESEILRSSYHIHSIRISYASSVNDLGKFSFRKILLVFTIFIKLFKELLIYKPNLIYFQISPLGLTFVRDSIFVLIMKLFRVKIVFHLRGKGIEKVAKRSVLAKKAYQWTFEKQFVICLSELLSFDVLPVFKDNPFIVNDGIPDIKVQKEVNCDINKSNITILYFSNLLEFKGIFDYLAAISSLSKYNSNLLGIIAGNEGDVSQEQLLLKIKEYGLNSCISYLGPKYGIDKNNLLSSCDVLVYPTKEDCFPGVLLEAMQSFLPIVATNEGAIPEIIDDGITGFIVDKASPDQLAEKIQLLIDNPELRKSMGIAGRKKYVEKYTLAHFENNLLSVFNTILKK